MLPKKYPKRTITEKHILIIILSLGLLARVIYFEYAENIIHPDEIIQYAEQAHAEVFGYGLEPWEYRFEIRSWFLPATISTVLASLNQLGLSEPGIYTKVVRLIMSLASCSLILSCHRITKNCFPGIKNGPIIAALITAFWIEVVVYAPRATPEVLASYALCGAIAISTTQGSSTKEKLTSGILIGLAAGLRYQYLPAITILSILAVKKLRIRAITIILLGILSSSLVIIIVDSIKWGNPAKPLINNFRINAIEGISSSFGIEPWSFYINQITTSSIYLIATIIAIYPFAVFLNKKLSRDECKRKSKNEIKSGNFYSLNNILTAFAIAIVTIITHSIIPHKELRFTFAVIPITICLITGTTSHILESIHQKIEKIKKYAPSLLNYLCALFSPALIIYLAARSWPNNFAMTYYKNLLSSSEPLAVTKYLRSLDNTSSILRLDASRGYSGGYYYLHLNSRLYGKQNILKIKPENFYQYFSHIVLKKGKEAPRYFEKVRDFTSSSIYLNTITKSDDLLTLDGYDKIHNNIDHKIND